MTSQTQHIPPDEWRTLILKTNESRLFRNITQEAYEEGVEALDAVQCSLLWQMGVMQ